MKKFLSVLLCLAIVFGTFAVGGEGVAQLLEAISVRAGAETCGVFEYSIENNEVTITGCDASAEGNIVIPGIIAGCPVTRIGEKAFFYCVKIKSLTIPASVTDIGLLSVGGFEIIVRPGNPVYHSADGCLIETESKKLIAMGEYSVIPDDGSVTSIGDYTIALSRFPYIPATVTDISELALAGVNYNTEIKNPVIVSPDNPAYYSSNGCVVEKASGKLIYGWSSPIDNNHWSFIPDDGNVKTISKYALFPPADILDIAEDFNEALVVIPSSVTQIEEGAFPGEVELHVSYDGTQEEWNGIEIGADNDALINAQFVFEHKDHVVENPESILSYKINDGEVTIIGFSDNSEAEDFFGKLVIPDTIEGYPVTAIKSVALVGAAFSSVEIPASVTTIIKEDGYTGGFFGFCFFLESVTVSPGNPVFHSAGNCLIETASRTLVAGCKNSVIPDDGSVTSIGEFAFAAHPVKNITIPEGVTSIGLGAFCSCDYFQNIEIPESVTSIGSSAFAYSSIESVTIGSNVAEIGAAAFSAIHGVKSISVSPGNPVYHSAGNCLIETASGTLVAGGRNCVIPFGGSVTTIGDNAFGLGTVLNNRIEIPDGVTNIGKQAFSGTELDVLILPASVTEIGDNAFRTGDVKNVFFTGTEEQWNAISIGSYNNGLNTANIHFNYGNYDVLDYSITGNKEIVITGCDASASGEVVIPATIEGFPVTKIGDEAFRDCKIKSLTIPASVTSVGTKIFFSCGSLKNIIVEQGNPVYHSSHGCLIETESKTLVAAGGCWPVIPEDGSVTSIGDYVFWCGPVYIPSTITYISDVAFSEFDINATTDMVFSIAVSPDNPVYHSADAGIIESGSGRLVFGFQLMIDDSVKIIGRHSFEALKEKPDILIIPKSVIQIEEGAFPVENNLGVLYDGTQEDWNRINIGADNDALINAQFVFDYKNLVVENPESILKYEINDGEATITGIKESSDLADGFRLDIPGTIDGYPVTRIDTDLSGFTSINIPASVTYINPQILSSNVGFFTESLTVSPENPVYRSAGNCIIETATGTLIAGCKNSVIPDDGSVTSIGDYAFCGAFLKSIEIPNTITRIGHYAFAINPDLKSIVIPDSVTSIGFNAFSQCFALENVTIGSGLSEITELAFGTWFGVRNFTVSPDNPVLHSAGNCVIETASGTLVAGGRSSVIPDDGSVTSIGANAFGMCCLLKSLEIPDGVTSIGDYAFQLSILDSLIIPASVTTIGNDNFSNSDGPDAIYYGGTQEQWNEISARSSNMNYEYTPVDCTLTVNYVMADGSNAPQPNVSTVRFCDMFEVASPAVEGYTPDVKTVAGRMDDMNGKTITVYYTRDNAALTVFYLFQNGETAAAPYNGDIGYGETYSIPSPAVIGHTPDIETVEGTMGAEPVSVNVTYSPKPHTVTWKLDGGNIDGSTDDVVQNYYFGDSISEPAAPVKNGFSFTGWGVEPASSVPDEDLEYTACWAKTNNFGMSHRFSFANVKESFNNPEYYYRYTSTSTNAPKFSYYLSDSDTRKLFGYIDYYTDKKTTNINDKPLYKSATKSAVNKMRVTGWLGSCFGMAAVSVLDYNGQIDFRHNFGEDAATLSQVNEPKTRKEIMSAINYYFVSQLLNFVTSSNVCRYERGDYPSNLSVSTHPNGNIVRDVIEKGEPFLFPYNFEDHNGNQGGHAIVGICQVAPSEENKIITYPTSGFSKHYCVKAYDNLYPQDDTYIHFYLDSAGAIVACYVKTPENEYEVTWFKSYLKFNQNFKQIDIDGPNNNFTDMSYVDPDTGAISAELENSTRIFMNKDADVLIENAAGEKLTIINGRKTGTLSVKEEDEIVYDGDNGEPAPPTMIYYVDSSESFTVEPLSQTADVAVMTGSMYASATVTNADSIVFRDGEGVYVEGEDVDYRLVLSSADSAYDTVIADGNSENDASLTYSENNDIILEEDGTGEENVTVFIDEKIENYEISEGYEDVQISTDENNAIEIKGSSGDDGVYDVDVAEKIPVNPYAAVREFSVDKTEAVRGENINFTVVTADDVNFIRLNETVDGQPVSAIGFTRNSAGASRVDNGDGTAVWTLTITASYVDYSKVSESREYSISCYNTYSSTFFESDVAPVNITVMKQRAGNYGEETEPFSVISASAAPGKKLTYTGITVKTTDDVSKIRLTVNGKSTVYCASSKNVERTDNGDGTVTWVIGYRFLTAGEYSVLAECRGNTWDGCSSKTVTAKIYNTNAELAAAQT